MAEKSFQKKSFVIETKDRHIYWGLEGPSLPEPRFMHCMVSINSTHSFLHGGRTPVDSDVKFQRNFKVRFGQLGFREWFYTSSPNVTANNSYIYDWKKDAWHLVLFFIVIYVQFFYDVMLIAFSD